MQQQAEYVFNTPTPLLVTKQELRVPSHGKRVIANLPYDPSGLRTTKTATWEALDKVCICIYCIYVNTLSICIYVSPTISFYVR